MDEIIWNLLRIMISLSCLRGKTLKYMKMRGAKDRPPLKGEAKLQIGEAVLDNRRAILDKDKDGYYK